MNFLRLWFRPRKRSDPASCDKSRSGRLTLGSLPRPFGGLNDLLPMNSGWNDELSPIMVQTAKAFRPGFLLGLWFRPLGRSDPASCDKSRSGRLTFGSLPRPFGGLNDLLPMNSGWNDELPSIMVQTASAFRPSFVR